MVVEDEDQQPYLLRRVIADISSLISLSETIRVFSVKWQLIRSKLHELNAGLIAAENNHHHHHDNNPISDLAAALTCTASECRTLAGKCISVNYSGKLLMQSDLDLLISKLDSHARSLARIFNAVGVLHNDGFALVVSNPGAGATRDDMRFYVRDLLTRVRIGDAEMKQHALASLSEVILAVGLYARVVSEMDDFTTVMLSGLLESSDGRVQEEAVRLVRVISEVGGCNGSLVKCGVIAPLIRVIESGGGSSSSSLVARENAVRGLMSLTEGGDNAWAVSAHGGVTALLRVCERECELVGPACWVLRNLVGVDEIKRFMIEEGAVGTMVRLVKGRDEGVLIGAVEFLRAIAVGDDCVRHLVVRDGGVRALVRVFDPKNNAVSFKARETALRAIENLCYSCVEYVGLLVSYGFMDQVLYFLRKGGDGCSIQELAFKSASRLCCCTTSEEARKVMGEAGFMPEFVKFLEAKSYEIREMAAEALAVMVTVPKNRKKFASDDQNIVLVLQLLDPKEGGNSGNFKFLLSILLSLSSCNHARRIIASSGYVNNIHKLADAGVSDAKRIVRKLSANRFKNMLNGIWHS